MLYLIERIDDADYDENRGVLVRESSEVMARERAANACGVEGPGPWLDAERTTCRALSLSGDPDVLLIDHLNG